MANGEQSGWLVQVLRLTIFTTASLPNADKLWLSLTGQPPETDDQRPRELSRHQVGQFEDVTIDVQTNPARTDILMLPAKVEGIPLLEFGSFEGRAARFTDLACSWLEGLQADVIRIAFGAVVFLPAESRQKAYEDIGRYVPSIKVDAESTRELMYRVNRPRTGTNGVELNRITIWNAVSVKKAIIAGQIAAGSTEEHFSRLEIDNSTPVERTSPLDREQLVAIFRELVKMGMDNAARGELP